MNDLEIKGLKELIKEVIEDETDYKSRLETAEVDIQDLQEKAGLLDTDEETDEDVEGEENPETLDDDEDDKGDEEEESEEEKDNKKTRANPRKGIVSDKEPDELGNEGEDEEFEDE